MTLLPCLTYEQVGIKNVKQDTGWQLHFLLDGISIKFIGARRSLGLLLGTITHEH